MTSRRPTSFTETALRKCFSFGAVIPAVHTPLDTLGAPAKCRQFASSSCLLVADITLLMNTSPHSSVTLR